VVNGELNATHHYSLLTHSPFTAHYLHMSPPDDQEPTEEERWRSNLILLIVAVVVVVVGVYLFNWMIDQLKLQECLESGRFNCAPIITPAR